MTADRCWHSDKTRRMICSIEVSNGSVMEKDSLVNATAESFASPHSCIFTEIGNGWKEDWLAWKHDARANYQCTETQLLFVSQQQ